MPSADIREQSIEGRKWSWATFSFSRCGVSSMLHPLFLRDTERVCILRSLEKTSSSLRSDAPKVTLSGFSGGESLPLRRSKGAAFPSLLTLEGAPLLPRVALRQGCLPPKEQGNSPAGEVYDGRDRSRL